MQQDSVEVSGIPPTVSVRVDLPQQCCHSSGFPVRSSLFEVLSNEGNVNLVAKICAFELNIL